jgi:hypothetical protein
MYEGETINPADVFPLLVPQNGRFQSYQGYLTVQGYEFLFRIELNEEETSKAKIPSLKGATIECGPELKEILRGYEEKIQQVTILFFD